MSDEEMIELLIRMDERGKRMEDKFDTHAETTNKRLDAHAHDLKGLREWRNYISGGIAVIAGALGLHLKGAAH